MLPKHVPLKTMTHADAVLKPFSPDPKGGGGRPGRGSFAWGSVLRCAMSTFAELLQQVQAKQPDPLRMGIFLEFGSIEWWICPFFGFSRYESDISRLLARCNTFEDHGDLLPSLTIDITEHPKPKRPSLTSHASQESQASQLFFFFGGWPKIQRGRIFWPEKKPWLPRSSNLCEVGSCESPRILTGKSRKMTANKSAVPWASVMPALETPQSLKQRLGFR